MDENSYLESQNLSDQPFQQHFVKKCTESLCHEHSDKYAITSVRVVFVRVPLISKTLQRRLQNTEDDIFLTDQENQINRTSWTLLTYVWGNKSGLLLLYKESKVIKMKETKHLQIWVTISVTMNSVLKTKFL